MTRLPGILVRMALRAFPRAFRERLGEDLELAFEDWVRSVRSSELPLWIKWFRVARLALGTMTSVFVAGFGERLYRQRRARETDRKGTSGMESFVSDLRNGLGQMLRRPVFALVAIVTLGLGVGANAAIFSVIDAVLLSPLPYPSPDRIVSTWMSMPDRDMLRWGLSLHDYEDWKTGPRVFDAFAVYNASTANLGGIETPQRIAYVQVSPGFFPVLGVMPRLGRAFREEENQPGAADVVIVSHAFWRDRLASDPGAIGRTVTMDGSPVTVIGVMPEGFAFPSAGTEAWRPFGMAVEAEGSRGGRWLAGIARLRQGESLESAQRAMSSFATSLARAYPETNENVGIFLEPLLDSIVSSVRPSLLILWGAVGLVLLIAGANVAGLILARAVDRRTEFAVRSALGAGRRRLVRQLLAESVPLSLSGGMCGVAIGWGGARLLSMLAANRVPRAGAAGVDATVFLYTLGIALLAGIGFSLVPALSVTRTNVATRIREGSRGSAGHLRVMARETLVVGQIALAVLVLIGASLLVRTFRAVSETSPGFDTERLLTFRIAPSWSEIADRAEAADLFGRIVDAMRSTPGVLAAGAVNRLPLSGSWWATAVRKEGQADEPTSGRRAYTRVITPGYLETIGLPVERGRGPLESDRANGRLVVAINRTMAEAIWPGEDAIGRRFTIGGPFWYEVVGIVGDERYNSLSQPTAPVMYMPFRQGTFGHFQDWGMTVVLRTAGDPAALAATIRARVQAIAPSIPIFSMNTFDSIIERDVAAQRFNAVLFGAFGLLALVLSAIGVYGLLAYIVVQRTREIGVRMAMGAARPAIVGLIVGRGILLAAIGSAIGIVTALALARILASMLVGVGPHDAVAFGSSTLILFAVALTACLIPAWRATRIVPIAALRSD
jgi:putative ABC transport system permease protein